MLDAQAQAWEAGDYDLPASRPAAAGDVLARPVAGGEPGESRTQTVDWLQVPARAVSGTEGNVMITTTDSGLTISVEAGDQPVPRLHARLFGDGPLPTVVRLEHQPGRRRYQATTTAACARPGPRGLVGRPPQRMGAGAQPPPGRGGRGPAPVAGVSQPVPDRGHRLGSRLHPGRIGGGLSPRRWRLLDPLHGQGAWGMWIGSRTDPEAGDTWVAMTPDPRVSDRIQWILAAIGAQALIQLEVAPAGWQWLPDQVEPPSLDFTPATLGAWRLPDGEIVTYDDDTPYGAFYIRCTPGVRDQLADFGRRVLRR